MAYFDLIPNIEVENRPLSFPFSETEYTLAKNFFKRNKLRESSYNFTNFFSSYVLTDDDRIDYLAYKVYGNSQLDWVILLTNNIINPLFDLPVKDNLLYDLVNKSYIDSPGNPSIQPADRIHHYETLEKKNSLGKVVLKAGLKVEKSFYDGTYSYNDDGYIITVNGNTVSLPVTNYMYEQILNAQKRNIYLLRETRVEEFISQFKENMKYSRSSSYIDRTTKRVGI